MAMILLYPNQLTSSGEHCDLMLGHHMPAYRQQQQTKETHWQQSPYRSLAKVTDP